MCSKFLKQKVREICLDTHIRCFERSIVNVLLLSEISNFDTVVENQIHRMNCVEDMGKLLYPGSLSTVPKGKEEYLTNRNVELRKLIDFDCKQVRRKRLHVFAWNFVINVWRCVCSVLLPVAGQKPTDVHHDEVSNYIDERTEKGQSNG